MPKDLQEVAELLQRAIAPEEVFGALDGPKALSVSYRQLVRRIHPDKFENADDIAEANNVLIQLTSWKVLAEQKLAEATYGDGRPVVRRDSVAVTPQVIQTPNFKYFVRDIFAVGDLADLYSCSYVEKEGKKVAVNLGARIIELDEAPEKPAVFKIVQNAGDNDLLENEAKMLRKLYPATQKDEKFYRYLPRLFDSFALRSSGGPPRRVNVFPLLENYFSVAQVKTAYPGGLDYRDVAWMYRRVLEGLYFLHEEKGVVHGALLPPHIMVHPVGHGAKLIDWSYSVEIGGRVTALSSPYKNYYAPEILTKRSVSAQTDIYMAAKCFVTLVNGDVSTNRMPDEVPQKVRRLIESCLLESPSRRPDSASALHEEFSTILEKLVGKPRYRPLIMPKM